jgi:Gram-negative bacterial TonB protein C-terminal
MNKLVFKILLAFCFSAIFTELLMAQMPENEVATFVKKRKGVFTKSTWQRQADKPTENEKDTLSATDNSQVYQAANYPNWRQYARGHLKYPELAQENFVEGTVYAEAEINHLGEVVSVKIIRGLGFGCDEAVIDLLHNMPRWEPCLKKGIPKAQIVCIPVKFSLM